MDYVSECYKVRYGNDPTTGSTEEFDVAVKCLHKLITPPVLSRRGDVQH